MPYTRIFPIPSWLYSEESLRQVLRILTKVKAEGRQLPPGLFESVEVELMERLTDGENALPPTAHGPPTLRDTQPAGRKPI